MVNDSQGCCSHEVARVGHDLVAELFTQNLAQSLAGQTATTYLLLNYYSRLHL